LIASTYLPDEMVTPLLGGVLEIETGAGYCSHFAMPGLVDYCLRVSMLPLAKLPMPSLSKVVSGIRETGTELNVGWIIVSTNPRRVGTC